MKALAPLLLALAAGCATAAPPGEPVKVTLYGPEARLETWEAEIVRGAHTHGRAQGPCQVSMLMEGISILRILTPDEKSRQLGENLGEIVHGFCAAAQGRAHGGSGRLVLGLRRGRPPSEALLVVVPQLGPEEEERTFPRDQIAAEWERPAGTGEAVLENGWIRLRRLGADRYDFELFLVLRPSRSDAGYERLQAVARGEASLGR